MAVSDYGQDRLFDARQEWERHWVSMPDFVQDEAPRSFDSITVHFRNAEDRRAFLDCVGEHHTRRDTIWYPKPETLTANAAVSVPANRYPIYVISKGRWATRYTARRLDELGIDYRMVIEPQERASYAEVIDAEKLLVLPFSNLGQGSIPARNWVWEHSLVAGHAPHWILDDNLKDFYRLNDHHKTRCADEGVNPFTPVEDLVDRYENVALAGLNYQYLASRHERHAAFRLNTRIYSCILINNAIPYRWRGRYNEDTDLSLRVLKDGWVTVLFNAFLCDKQATMVQGGGNTDELYQGNGRLEMAESLRRQHPDVVGVTTKWGRPQHHVNYKPFRNNRLVPISERGDTIPLADVHVNAGGTWST